VGGELLVELLPAARVLAQEGQAGGAARVERPQRGHPLVEQHPGDVLHFNVVDADLARRRLGRGQRAGLARGAGYIQEVDRLAIGKPG